MNDVIAPPLCSCPRRHPGEEAETPCGEPMSIQDADGNWYWCWYCDGHWSECGNKGSPNYAQCPSDPPPPCRFTD